MGIDRGTYTSRRVAPENASWATAADWESGDLSSVDLEGDRIRFRGTKYGEPPASGIARWPLEETVEDVWGERDGVNRGASFTSDSELRDGAWFNAGSEDYIALPQVQLAGPEISVSAWVKPSYHGESPYDRVLSAGTYQPFNLVIYGHGSDSWDPYFDITTEHDRGTAGQPWEYRDQTLAWDTRHHLLGVYGGGYVRMYVDGSEIASQQLTGELDTSKYGYTTYSYIGTREKEISGGPIQEFLSGFLKDVRVYDKVLSPSEAVKLYETGTIDG
jgi:hypothetical protein